MNHKLINNTVTNSLAQLRPTRRPRAACSRVEGFVQSSKLVLILYVQYNDNLSFFDSLKFDTFDAVAFSAYLSCTAVDFHVSLTPRCKMDFQFSDHYSCVPLH